MLEDIAILTGGQVIRRPGHQAGKRNLKDLGKAKRISG
jgi:chaperonin GroEL (HSP60 family)